MLNNYSDPTVSDVSISDDGKTIAVEREKEGWFGIDYTTTTVTFSQLGKSFSMLGSHGTAVVSTINEVSHLAKSENFAIGFTYGVSIGAFMVADINFGVVIDEQGNYHPMGDFDLSFGRQAALSIGPSIYVNPDGYKAMRGLANEKQVRALVTEIGRGVSKEGYKTYAIDIPIPALSWGAELGVGKGPSWSFVDFDY